MFTQQPSHPSSKILRHAKSSGLGIDASTYVSCQRCALCGEPGGGNACIIFRFPTYLLFFMLSLLYEFFVLDWDRDNGLLH